MKKLIATFLLAAFAVTLQANDAAWLTDFTAATKKAKDENKPLMMLFTGSDWCPYCIKWEKEVFSQPEFLSYAKEKLVLLMVDFPNKKKLPKALQKHNDKLLEKFKVEEYPTALVLDSNGKRLGKLNYEPGGPKVFFGKMTGVLEGNVAKKQ